MAQKRVVKAAEEAKESKANEMIRRKGGKVSIDFPCDHKDLILTTYDRT